jgi:hypothetical protein
MRLLFVDRLGCLPLVEEMSKYYQEEQEQKEEESCWR